MVLDRDGSFFGHFKDKLEQLSVDIFFVLAEAHWEMGTIERHNESWGHMFNRVADEQQVRTEEEVDLLAAITNLTKNESVRHCGFSPRSTTWAATPERQMPSCLHLPC
jgi:IS30 family transposase